MLLDYDERYFVPALCRRLRRRHFVHGVVHGVLEAIGVVGAIVIFGFALRGMWS